MQSAFSLIRVRNFGLIDYKNINLDTICCRKNTGHKKLWTMALVLSSDKNNPKTRTWSNRLRNIV